MPLPEPSTRSAGSLKLIYGLGSELHSMGVHFLSTATISDIGVAHTTALGLANVVKDMLAATEAIQAWEITDPLGAVLHRESFSPIILGTASVGSGGIFASTSASKTFIGRGVGTVFGEKTGVTRTVIFTGRFDLNNDSSTKISVGTSGPVFQVYDYLNASLVIGADFYGQKASYAPYITNQLNAHWQSKTGF